MIDRRFELLLALAVFVTPLSSAADENDATPVEDSTTVEARNEFVRGAELVNRAKWAEALRAFQRSSALKPHPVTSYNIAACQRALGRYAAARVTLDLALAGVLPENIESEARAWVSELDALLARVFLRVTPADAALSVDGRPLARATIGGRQVWVAGATPPGAGRLVGSTRVEVVLDPGAHVFTLARKGFSNAVVNKSFGPATRTQLELSIDRLPATLHVSANVPRAVVRVDGVDVGGTPVDVSRPAGRYRVVVKRDGYVDSEALVSLRAGEETRFSANLPKDEPALTTRWWFWTAAGVVVAGAAVGTYFATRSEPEPRRPPLDGGGLGWAVEVR